jgi:hypothetical protein
VRTGRKDAVRGVEDVARGIRATLEKEAAMSLRGKHALVIGGSRGIGRGIALNPEKETLVRLTTACMLVAAAVVLLVAQHAYSQTALPQTVEVDVPFEMLAPWYSPDGSEVEDEVMLRGTLKVTTRTWQTRPDHIDRFYLHANAVDIHGTSETTGQRFRLTGSFKFDLHHPEVTFNPDGTFDVPTQDFTLRLQKVDPEPARLTEDLFGSTGATAAVVGPAPPVTIPCERIVAPDGTPTQSIHCGSVTFYYFLKPLPRLYRVMVGDGDACVPGTTCVVPDGATLFNGYTGDYDPPLFMLASVYLGETPWGTEPGAYSLRWRCKTGEREAPVGTTFTGGGYAVIVGRCQPIYSATEPIKVWADVSYKYTRRLSSGALQEVTEVVKEKEFTFHMDERLVDQPPVITSFSVESVSRINGRCSIGAICELVDGDVIYNTQVGDYERDLTLRVTASDPEGDPIFVEWFCQSGSFFAPITASGGLASCTAGYIYPDAISVYARVSDGNNFVWTPQRLLYMLEFIQ